MSIVASAFDLHALPDDEPDIESVCKADKNPAPSQNGAEPAVPVRAVRAFGLFCTTFEQDR